MYTQYDYSSLHGYGGIFTYFFTKKGTDRRTEETEGQTDGRMNERPDVYQFTPIFQSGDMDCEEIFDEQFHYSKYERKENWTNTGKNKRRRLVPNPTLSPCIPDMTILACMVVEKSLAIKHKKGTFGRTEGRNGRTDEGQTD